MMYKFTFTGIFEQRPGGGSISFNAVTHADSMVQAVSQFESLYKPEDGYKIRFVETEPIKLGQ